MGDPTTVPTTYPLSWPPGWPRTPHPQVARFMTRFADARAALFRELRLMGAVRVVLSSNAELTRHGEPRSKHRVADPGAAVWFELDGATRCIPCDRWDTVDDNVQALRLTAQALRGLARWGAQELVAASVAGFRALPPTSGDAADPWAVLGLAPTATAAEIERAYLRLAKRHHPDVGGDIVEFRRVTQAYGQARAVARA